MQSADDNRDDGGAGSDSQPPADSARAPAAPAASAATVTPATLVTPAAPASPVAPGDSARARAAPAASASTVTRASRAGRGRGRANSARGGGTQAPRTGGRGRAAPALEWWQHAEIFRLCLDARRHGTSYPVAAVRRLVLPTWNYPDTHALCRRMDRPVIEHLRRERARDQRAEQARLEAEARQRAVEEAEARQQRAVEEAERVVRADAEVRTVVALIVDRVVQAEAEARAQQERVESVARLERERVEAEARAEQERAERAAAERQLEDERQRARALQSQAAQEKAKLESKLRKAKDERVQVLRRESAQEQAGLQTRLRKLEDERRALEAEILISKAREDQGAELEHHLAEQIRKNKALEAETADLKARHAILEARDKTRKFCNVVEQELKGAVEEIERRGELPAWWVRASRRDPGMEEWKRAFMDVWSRKTRPTCCTETIFQNRKLEVEQGLSIWWTTRCQISHQPHAIEGLDHAWFHDLCEKCLEWIETLMLYFPRPY